MDVVFVIILPGRWGKQVHYRSTVGSYMCRFSLEGQEVPKVLIHLLSWIFLRMVFSFQHMSIIMTDKSVSEWIALTDATEFAWLLSDVPFLPTLIATNGCFSITPVWILPLEMAWWILEVVILLLHHLHLLDFLSHLLHHTGRTPV